MPIQSRKLADLRDEYTSLFDTCVIRPERLASVNDVVRKILSAKNRYLTIEGQSGVPWHVVASIHNLECSLDFGKHLHNGDSLSRRTVRVPAGRPISGSPPFTFEQSALDALKFDKLTTWSDWSLPGTLFKFEGFNGFGSRGKGINTPYLWSFSTHYTRGKFIADNEWSPTAVSKQCGVAVILRRLAELGEIDFSDQPVPQPGSPPMVVAYRKKKSTDPEEVARAEALQRWLNQHPGIFLTIDGHPGKLTSDAYRVVTGHFLPGDPRGV